MDREAAIQLFDQVLDVWSGGNPSRIRELVTRDYQGHMLHLADGDRTADTYGDWIHRFRKSQPDVEFQVVAQGFDGDRLWSQLAATGSDGRTAYGMNTSRFRDGLLAEEWALWSEWLGNSPI
ncbi:MAG: SnoaL-like polyketide cyclase [Pseudonocardiales bacterium]|nr:SnoaL-like polyketide cyclase [Pseudonocardiales bacterium]MDT4908300.1 SnoaL-like polyketide cyclase [Pseudonocardiales bacterium]MDT4962669.1 SnoaL-like polyketide cyclase [Pseudonocardiales bacterium]